MDALEQLRERTAELADLAGLEMLASWDQRVTMPSAGAGARAHQLAALSRLAHERATGQEIGAWLEQLDGRELAGVDADIVRLAQRDFERAQKVPAELVAERSSAHAQGEESWLKAREADDFAAFAPALERNVRLARAYGECVAEPDAGVYEALLQDYDFGLRTEQLERLFGELAGRLAPLVEEASARFPRQPLAVPVSAQRAAVENVLERLGVESASWRVDVSAHPFTAWLGQGDTRLTTRYSDRDVESLLSSLHEYGHALYERQVDPQLARTNLASGTSMSVHESQSKLWENHVARNPAFGHVLCDALRAGGAAVELAQLRAALSGVERTLIRVSADPLTYPLHIVLRFQLELAMIEGELPVSELPGAWRERTRELLGLEVPSDALGCLQDIHWGAGAFGYFPSYALGCLIAAQLWEAMESELGSLEEDLRSAQLARVQGWLGERVHRYGRRLDTLPLLEQASGRALEVEPFLRYAAALSAA